MKSKIIGYVLVASFFLTLPIYAQETTSADDIVVEMKKELKLTQQQSDAVKPIIKENMAKREELRQSIEDQPAVADTATIQSKIRQLDQDENQKLSQILTQDQMKKWIQKQQLRNAFNKDQIGNTRWPAKDDKSGFGTNF